MADFVARHATTIWRKPYHFWPIDTGPTKRNEGEDGEDAPGEAAEEAVGDCYGRVEVAAGVAGDVDADEDVDACAVLVSECLGLRYVWSAFGCVCVCAYVKGTVR